MHIWKESPTANEEMRFYNMTMKVNRLELLKAKIGLELAGGFDELEKMFGVKLTEKALKKFERQAGILGKTVLDNEKVAHAIVNASFHNATFFERIWMYQGMLKTELDSLLQQGLVRGKNPRELARVQIEAQKQSFIRNGFEKYEYITCGNADVCEACKALDGKHFKISDMMPGENAPPMHPRCHCSVAAWEDSKEYEAWLEHLEKGGTTKEWKKLEKESVGMSATELFIKWPRRKKSISKEDYKELSSYARESGIVLEGFKRFDGDINIIKQVIDDANVAAKKFPEIKLGRKKLTILLDEFMNANDFAITNGHIIRINADAFRDVEVLRAEYEKLEKERWFVKEPITDQL